MWSITRNADVLTDALEQNEIDDPEIADIEDVGYDADGFKVGTIDITNINFAEDPGERNNARDFRRWRWIFN